MNDSMRGRQTKNGSVNRRYHFGKSSASSVMLNEEEGISSRASDSNGGYAVSDNFGNIRLVHSGQVPSFDYQKKYKLVEYDNNGERGAFVSITDNEAVNTLVEGWTNPTESMKETRRALAAGNEKDDGVWRAPNGELGELISDWKKNYTSISAGNNMGGYLSSGMKKAASMEKDSSVTVPRREQEQQLLKAQAEMIRQQAARDMANTYHNSADIEQQKAMSSTKFKMRQESFDNEYLSNVKNGMKVVCAGCGSNEITINMNFCPNCGHRFQ